jgi:hypothetical protein
MIIPVNKKRFPFTFLLGCLTTTILVTTTLNISKHANDPSYDLNIFLLALGILSIYSIFFTLVAFADYLKTIFDSKAALIINDHGVYDNLSIFSVGQVPWKEIEYIQLTKVLKNDFLILVLTHPQLYIQKQSAYKRKVLKSFLKNFGSPVVISQKRINLNLKDVKDLILEAKYK